MKNTIIIDFIYAVIQSIKDKFEIKKQIRKYNAWQKSGCIVSPPHLVKQKVIKEYQQKFGYTTLIETGTFKGDMIKAQLSNFDKIISIELGVELHRKAVRRFKNVKNVHIVQGDSGKVLPEILLDINEPVIFWLDGHYSAGKTAKGDKECPIFDELNAIFKGKHQRHILLIDDARLFIGENDYPTIKELTEFIKIKNDKYKIVVTDDIIKIAV